MGLEEVVKKEGRGLLSRFIKSRLSSVVLPLTLSSSLFLSSCTATFQHYDYKEDPKTKTEEEVIVEKSVNKKGIKYDIKQDNIFFVNRNTIGIPVVKEVYENRLIKKRIVSKSRFDQYLVEVTERSNPLGVGIGAGLLFGGLGALIGSGKDSKGKSHTGLGFEIGFGTGFLVGVLAGIFNEEAKIIETDEYKTEYSEIRTLSDRIVTENQDFSISSNPVSDLKLKLDNKNVGFEKYIVFTDKKGIAYAKIIQLPYNCAFSDERLIIKIMSWDKVRSLSSSIRDNLNKRVSYKIYNSFLSVGVETLDERNDMKNANVKETIKIPVRYIRESDVDDMVDPLLKAEEIIKKRERQVYINKTVNQFNSHIKTFTIYLEDDKSHARIPGEVTIVSYAPTAESFLDDYFSGDNLRNALSSVIPYLGYNEMIIRNAYSGEASFYLYVPARYNIKVVNPEYNFIEGNIMLEANDLDRKIRMVEKGSKVKINIFGESKGRIE